MKRSLLLVLVLALSGACKLVPDLSGFCWTMSGEGCAQGGSGSGSSITYVYARVTIGGGGTLAPASLTTVARTATQRPVIEWLNQDSISHRLVSDTQQFDSGDVEPGTARTVVLNLPGRYPYHCAIHPRMVGLIIVP